ncbi:MAG: hypothetical protein JOY93_12925 [Acidobacteriales bacterium]|nr:hypothetical protein [Terriglobales bacterium]
MKYKVSLAAFLIVSAVTLFSQQDQSAPSQAAAQSSASDISAMEQRMREMEERIIFLEGQVRMLKSEQPSAPSAASAPAQPAETTAAAQAPGGAAAGVISAEPSYGGAGGAASKALNPDISVIGDFIGAAGGNTAPPLATLQPFPAMQMHESEIGLQAIIDPYSRGDFFISFGEQGVNLEEGFITFTALPDSFVAKVGKMRSAFGKVNTMHNHVLPWIDRPLVSTNLVGGEDGIDDAGVSVQRILPAPKGIFLEATAQVFRGDSADVFKSSQNSDVSNVDHLRAYKDITESTNIDLGLSYARGHNDLGTNFITQLYGFDATVRWKPLRRAIYHSFVGRTELIWSQRHEFPSEQRAFGYYASGDYQFARRWFAGGRYDSSDRSRFANTTDKGGSIVLTYWPSEFSQIRGQYEFTKYAEGRNSNQLLMQLIFSLGAHGAHPF